MKLSLTLSGMAILLILVNPVFSTSMRPAYASAFSTTWSDGNYLVHNFTTDTVTGLEGSVEPIWLNQVPWGGLDQSIAFLINNLGVYDSQHTSLNPAHQVGLWIRAPSHYLDSVFQFAGQTSLTDVCSECEDGYSQHVLRISHTPSNGWTLYIDGSSVATVTCSCYVGDTTTKSYNQVPFSMEVDTRVTQASIDSSLLGFRIALDESILYLQQSSGNWISMPHAYAYYSYNSGTDFNVGTHNQQPPSWAAINTDAPFTDSTKTGTTTYLVARSPSAQLW